MKIINVLEASQILGEATVKIKGFLIYAKDYVYIVQDYESYQNTSISIQIVEPGFPEKVESSNAPPAGGGVSSYPYDVVVEGRLRYVDNSPFPAVIDSIKSAYFMNEDGDKYQVI